MLAATVIAIAIRFGVDLFCEMFALYDIIELRNLIKQLLTM